MSSGSESSKNTPPTPSPEEAKKAIVAQVDPYVLEAQQEDAAMKADVALAHLRGLRAFYTLREKWSYFILGCIAVLLIFHITLAFMVGLKKLDFTSYEWFLPIVATENFLQIIGLAIIVVKFLFSHPRPT